jgi:hypothetical protein
LFSLLSSSRSVVRAICWLIDYRTGLRATNYSCHRLELDIGPAGRAPNLAP